jgi:hypothetical protein
LIVKRDALFHESVNASTKILNKSVYLKNYFMKSNLLTIGIIAIAINFTACKKTEPMGPRGAQGPNGPSLTGNIKGYINHFQV